MCPPNSYICITVFVTCECVPSYEHMVLPQLPNLTAGSRNQHSWLVSGPRTYSLDVQPFVSFSFPSRKVNQMIILVNNHVFIMISFHSRSKSTLSPLVSFGKTRSEWKKNTGRIRDDDDRSKFIYYKGSLSFWEECYLVRG